MKIVTNPKLIARNAKIGLWGQIVGFILLLGAAWLSFQSVQWLGLSLILFAFGVLISQIGKYYGNRWSRRPRSDEHLDKSLKGLDRNYTLYHYRSPIAHLLIGPAGIWILLTRALKGNISYIKSKDRWKHRGGGALFRLFGQEGLGRPDLDFKTDILKIEKMLSTKLNIEPPQRVNAVLVFTNKDIQIDTQDSLHPAIRANQLKKFIRKQVKVQHLSAVVIQEINDLLTPK